MSNFKEYPSIQKKIEETKKQFNFSEVKMQGFHDELLKMKVDIEELYDKRIYYLGYSLDDAPFFGWTGNNLKEMREIDSEINKRIIEIYAIILKSTNSEIR